jgi:hypothetical protein
MRMRNALALVALATAIGHGCSAPPRAPDLADPDPALKIPAMKRGVKAGDTKALAQLVKDLDSDDPAVRFYAIRTLEELTGDRLGYVYFDDEVERKPALLRWNQWLAGQDPRSPAQADGSK